MKRFFESSESSDNSDVEYLPFEPIDKRLRPRGTKQIKLSEGTMNNPSKDLGEIIIAHTNKVLKNKLEEDDSFDPDMLYETLVEKWSTNMKWDKTPETEERMKDLVFGSEFTNPTLSKVLLADLEEPRRLELVETFHQFSVSETLSEKYELKHKFNVLINTQENDDLVIPKSFPEDIAAIIRRKKEELKHCEGEEFAKKRLEVTTAIKVPFGQIPSVNPLEAIPKLMRQFNEHLLGMESIKEEIAMFLHSKMLGRVATNLALVGSPGVGKTKIVRLISEAVGIPFSQISLGQISRRDTLMGHNPTYLGAREGLVAKSLIDQKTLGGIILWDELDDSTEEIQNVLLQITDPVQNKDFQDLFLPGLKIDLSNVINVFTMNSTRNLNAALKDRLSIIKVPDYTEHQQRQIIEQKSLPKICKQFSMNPEHFDILSVADFIVHRTEKSPGMRKLEATATDVFKRLDFAMTFGSDLDLSFEFNYYGNPIIDAKHLDGLFRGKTRVDENVHLHTMYT